MPYASKARAREYQRQYHLKNWSKLKEKHAELKKIRRAKLILWLKEYKKDLFCSICKENHPACLDFHHTNSFEKENSVANMIGMGYAIETIQQEIDKCIVLCRNCHAKEHYKLIHKLAK